MKLTAKSSNKIKSDFYTQVLKKEIGVEVVKEYRFDALRMFRFDYAIPELRIAIEIDGGLWIAGGGRHNRASGFINDMEKLNLATSKGWRILRFTHTTKLLQQSMDIIKNTINYKTNELCINADIE